MRVLSIKVPIRKKSGNLFNDPRIYIYIYVYVCVCVCVCVFECVCVYVTNRLNNYYNVTIHQVNYYAMGIPAQYANVASI